MFHFLTNVNHIKVFVILQIQRALFTSERLGVASARRYQGITAHIYMYIYHCRVRNNKNIFLSKKRVCLKFKIKNLIKNRAIKSNRTTVLWESTQIRLKKPLGKHLCTLYGVYLQAISRADPTSSPPHGAPLPDKCA